jgi:hypothetical protein
MVRIILCGLVLTLLFALPTVANPIAGCGWDYTDETILGMAGPGDLPVIASFVTDDPYVIGAKTLQLVNNSPTGYARAYLAYAWHPSGIPDMWGMLMMRHPETTGMPAVAVRVRYDDALPDDLDADHGEAMSLSVTTTPEWTWVDLNVEVEAGHTGLVLEIEFTGFAGDTIWIEDMYFEPNGPAYVETPCLEVNATETTSLSAVKDLFR